MDPDGIRYQQATTRTGTRRHAVPTDDPRADQHGAGSVTRSVCGAEVRLQHYWFRPTKLACRRCLTITNEGNADGS